MNLRKILLSVFSIGVVGLVVIAASNAFFSDTETSKDNVFVAGAIDLKIDSQAHYNNMVCVPNDLGGYWWQPEVGFQPGVNHYPAQEDVCFLSWESTDLTTGHKFFDYSDLKPGDFGENTISLIVHNNPSWVCAEIEVTADDDVTCTSPEFVDDPTCTEVLGGFEGEMRKNLSFAWWADDGDNILQVDEVDSLFFQSGAKLSNFLASAGGNTLYLTLADSLQNFFGTDGEPLLGEIPYYVGLAWCFGDMDIDETTGVITCNGATVNNEAQTDAMTADISFTAVQSRNNAEFRCEDTYKPAD